MLLITAFRTIDEFTGDTKVAWNFDNVLSLFTDPLYRNVTLRTIGIALGVTIVDQQTARDCGFAGIQSVPLRGAVSMPLYLHRNRGAPRSKVSDTFERLCRRRNGATDRP